MPLKYCWSGAGNTALTDALHGHARRDQRAKLTIVLSYARWNTC